MAVRAQFENSNEYVKPYLVFLFGWLEKLSLENPAPAFLSPFFPDAAHLTADDAFSVRSCV